MSDRTFVTPDGTILCSNCNGEQDHPQSYNYGNSLGASTGLTCRSSWHTTPDPEPTGDDEPAEAWVDIICTPPTDPLRCTTHNNLRPCFLCGEGITPLAPTPPPSVTVPNDVREAYPILAMIARVCDGKKDSKLTMPYSGDPQPVVDEITRVFAALTAKSDTGDAPDEITRLRDRVEALERVAEAARKVDACYGFESGYLMRDALLALRSALAALTEGADNG